MVTGCNYTGSQGAAITGNGRNTVMVTLFCYRMSHLQIPVCRIAQSNKNIGYSCLEGSHLITESTCSDKWNNQTMDYLYRHLLKYGDNHIVKREKKCILYRITFMMSYHYGHKMAAVKYDYTWAPGIWLMKQFINIKHNSITFTAHKTIFLP